MKAIKERSAGPDEAMARRSRATQALPSAIRRARAIAKALDSVIMADFEFHATVPWKIAYRIPRKKGRPKKRRTVLPS